MPDLMRVLTHTCTSNVSWEHDFVSDSGEEYTLYYHMERGWSCSCPGFNYRGNCRHVTDEELQSKRCGWAWDAFANTTYHEKVCPECGEDTYAFYYGA